MSNDRMNQDTMQALLFDRPGAAEDVLHLGCAPVPAPGAGEVRIRVAARVIQPADRLFIAGRYRVTPRFPQVAGFDGAGQVDAVGVGVDAAWLGRRVAFRNVGAWADFAVAPVRRIHAVPDDIGMRQACQFTLNPLTAWGLLATTQVSSGQRLLVTAGHASVSRWIAALGAARGIDITLVARDDSGWTAWSAGVGDTRSAATLAQLLQPLAAQRGFDAVIDPIGGPATLDLIDACAPGAALVSYGVLDDRPFELRASQLLYRNLRWFGFGIDRYLDALRESELAGAREAVWQLMREQPALTAVAASHPLRDHGAALRDSDRLVREGKVLFTQERA